MPPGVLYKTALLVLLSSLQPGRLQEEGTTCNGKSRPLHRMCVLYHLITFSLADTLHHHIHKNIVNLNSMIKSYIKRSEQFRAQMEENMSSLREDLSGLNDSVSNLSMCLQEHKQQTAAELAQLQTSLNTTQSSLETASSKLDLLTSTTAQLSTGHQQILANISDVECVDTEESSQLHQNLQNNLTHQLQDMQRNVTYILGPHTYGGTGGWRHVVYLDMTDPSTTCPSGWQLTGYSKRTCGRASDGSNTCDSVTFPVSGGEYSRVCGRIKAYQWATTNAFWSYHNGRLTTIDGAYVDGISVTHSSPRQHIWTFAAGHSEGNPGHTAICPCDASHTIHVPPFVGNDYFCESGVNERWDGSRHHTLHSNDTLWDGENCLSSSTCCSLHNPPYFVKQLPTPTTDDIEARMCLNSPSHDENIAVELVELYVQ